jgi:hypothetical protein
MAKEKHLFTADWHLGKILYKSNVIENNFYQAAFQLLDYAKTNGVNKTWNAGDLLDSIKPTEQTLNVLKQINLYLLKNKMTMYVISGNHDYPGNGRHWVELFSADDSEFGLKNYGSLPYVFSKSDVLACLDSEAQLMHWEDNPNNPYKFLMLHTPVSEYNNIPGKSKLYVSCKELRETKIGKAASFIIVGDTHITSSVQVEGYDYPVLSPGPIEMVYANESAEKYVYIVEYDTETKSFGSLEQHVLKCPYIRIQSDVLETTEDLDNFIETQIRNNPTYKFADFFENQVMLLIWCGNRELSNEARNRLTDILNPTDSIRDNTTHPLTVHVITKSAKKVVVNDVLQPTEDASETILIKPYATFANEIVETLQTKGELSPAGCEFLRNLVSNTNSSQDQFNLSWSTYNQI